MTAVSRQKLAHMLVWAFRDQKVETAKSPHRDALTLYCNVMALPLEEAAALVSCARSGIVPPSDPMMLARWTRGLCLLRELLAQPLCELELVQEGPAQASAA